jgi:hypothetical protein
VPSASASLPTPTATATMDGLQPLAALMTAVNRDRAFATAALLSDQVHQLRNLTSQSDQQLNLIKAARKQSPLRCPQLEGYASTAAQLGWQQRSLLRAIPVELKALTAELPPATTRVAAFQRKVDQISAQQKDSTDSAIVSEIAAYQTNADLLSQNLKSVQQPLRSIPVELARFNKKYRVAASAPADVSNLCRSRGKARTT